MIIYPALDLKGGKCVRLYQGEKNRTTLYDNEPLRQTKLFLDEGARALHVVDLDGAFDGYSSNKDVIEKIAAISHVPIQLGGGLRSREAVEHWLERGVERVVIATMAVEQPELALSLCKKWRNRIAIALDLRGGKIATRGWLQGNDELNPYIFLEPFVQAGIAAVIVTDISRDGTLKGTNIDLSVEFAKALPCEVIASGGISSLEDIIKLTRRDAIAGAICGRALYEGKFSLADAQMVANGKKLKAETKSQC